MFHVHKINYKSLSLLQFFTFDDASESALFLITEVCVSWPISYCLLTRLAFPDTDICFYVVKKEEYKLPSLRISHGEGTTLETMNKVRLAVAF